MASYVDNIPKDELQNYYHIDDFEAAYKMAVTNKNTHSAIDITVDKITVSNAIIHKCKYSKETFIRKIEFNNCYFLEDIEFENSNFEKQCTINKSFCDKRVALYNLTFLGNIAFNDFHINGDISIISGVYKHFSIDGICNGKITIIGGSYTTLNLGGFFSKFQLKFLFIILSDFKGELRISGPKTEIESIDIVGSSEEAAICIERVRVGGIIIHDFRNIKSLQFQYIHVLKTNSLSDFTIMNSYLGEAEFYAVDFASFDMVTFSNTHLVNCNFVNTKWKYEINPVGIHKDKNYYQENRETYRQLKYALSKQGDVINEQHFHSQEMRAHYRSLSWRKDFWIKLIIAFSYATSDFGQSISRPLIWLVGMQLVLFSILVKLNPDTYEDINFNSSEGLLCMLGNYLKLINPLHPLPDSYNGLVVLVDIIMRIWSSYMIYNFVRATRRFIK